MPVITPYAYYVAQANYSCGVYGAVGFGTCPSTGGGPAAAGNTASGTAAAAGPSGGLLANTGYDILIPLALGASLVLASAILLVKRLRRARRAA